MPKNEIMGHCYKCNRVSQIENFLVVEDLALGRKRITLRCPSCNNIVLLKEIYQ